MQHTYTHTSTPRTHIRTHAMQYVYTGALNPAAMQRVAALYSDALRTLDIRGPVPAQLSEDETRVDSSIMFDLSTNSLVGFCGTLGDSHVCNINGESVKLPAGPRGEHMQCERAAHCALACSVCVCVLPDVCSQHSQPRVCHMSHAPQVASTKRLCQPLRPKSAARTPESW
jgi:hypothetical protein